MASKAITRNLPGRNVSDFDAEKTLESPRAHLSNRVFRLKIRDAFCVGFLQVYYLFVFFLYDFIGQHIERCP